MRIFKHLNQVKMDNMTFEDLIYGAAGWVEFTDSDSCNEDKAGFRIYFYLLPMIY